MTILGDVRNPWSEEDQDHALPPQSNGLVEHLNRTLLTLLSFHVSENQEAWDTHLPEVVMAYRIHTFQK